MTFYSPAAFLFLITIPVIIFLYLLKQRHEAFTVSSLYLWEEVLRDLEANAPWQKLRRNILMLLQIAAMLLLVFALAKPFLNAVGGKAGNVVVILDTSLSMQATDTKPSRFETAKRQASGYISGLGPEKLVTLISMGNHAIIEENVSKDKSSVQEKLKEIKVTNGTANLEDAASLIQSIVKQYPDTEVALFGDEELKIPGIRIQFADVSRHGDNYAVTLLSHSRGKNGLTVLTRIANFSPQEATLPVSLYTDGSVYDAKKVTAKAGETVNVYWNAVPADSQLLECRIDREDSLDADNTAWNVVNTDKTSRVLLISQKNVFVEKVLSLTNGIELYKTSMDEMGEVKGFDLYIFDGFLPGKLPGDGNIIIFNPPGNNYFQVEGEIETPDLEKPGHEFFKYSNDSSFVIGSIKKMTVPRWGEPVLESRQGPVIFRGTLENRRVVVFGFDLHHSDIPLKPVFPILMTNVLEWLIPSRINNVESIVPGQGIDFNLNPKAEQVKVVTPAGRSFTIAPPFPAAVFDGTEDLGKYTLEQKIPEGTSYHYFTVNAPAERESNLTQSNVKAGENTVSGAVEAAGRVNTGYNLQMILLCLLLMLLMIEWWVYSNDVTL